MTEIHVLWILMTIISYFSDSLWLIEFLMTLFVLYFLYWNLIDLRAAGVAQYVGGNAYYTIFNWLPSYFHDNFPEAKVSGQFWGSAEKTLNKSISWAAIYACSKESAGFIWSCGLATVREIAWFCGKATEFSVGCRASSTTSYQVCV